MSAIAHWLEIAGISTVVVGLVKLHLEKMLPPRALWVPFELGRPLGPPSNPQIQRAVLEQALKLVESSERQTLADFHLDDPRFIADTDWQPPDTGTHQSVLSECTALKPHYQRGCVDKSRTTVGVAKVAIEELATLFDEVYAENEFKPVRTDISDRLMFRLAMDDLKSYYIEAALAGRGNPSSRQIYDWLWQETLLGSRLREFRHRFMDSDNAKVKDLGTKFIVPHLWRD